MNDIAFAQDGSLETAYRIAEYVKRPMEEIFFFKELQPKSDAFFVGVKIR